MNRFVCINCGYTVSERDLKNGNAVCPDCGVSLHSVSQRYKPGFTGSAGEYFRIWIVNTFLTILTLGIYAPWAKVRERRFFYKHTIIEGISFDYTAAPAAILKGYLIIGGGILLYNLAKAYNPLYSLLVFGIFSLVLSFLIYKSLRFFARNSVYRNIRFHFRGTIRESYKTYLLYPLLIPFTLGLIVPYWAFQRKKYFFGNLAFGTTNNLFHGRAPILQNLYYGRHNADRNFIPGFNNILRIIRPLAQKYFYFGSWSV